MFVTTSSDGRERVDRTGREVLRHPDTTGPARTDAATPSTEEVRRDVLETALRISVGLGGVVWLIGAGWALRRGAPHAAAGATLMYAWIVALFLARSLPVRARAAAGLLPAFIYGGFLLFHLGPFSLGMVWPFAAVAMGAAMFSRATALAGVAAYGVLLVAVGTALELGALSWGRDPAAVAHWWVLSCSLMLIAVVAVPAISRLSRSMERSLAQSRAMEQELRRERTRLVEANAGLRAAIAELHRAEQERERLAAAVEHAGTLIAILDAGWRVEYVNPAFERTTGFTRDEAAGRPVDVVGGLGDDAHLRREIEARVAEGTAWAGRLRNRRRDGTSYEAEATISRIGGAGRVGYVAVLRDISREAALEAQLRQSQKMEAMGTLAGGIAHDFNNLLVPILGCTDAVRERLPADDEAQQMLSDVKAAAERARDLVSQILTISRKAEPRREATLVAPIVREAARLLRAMLPAGIRIEERIAADAGPVRADATEVHQIIMNLATNAYHAMRRSGGILTLAVEPVAPDRLPPGSPARPAAAYLRITVGDTGVGMDERTLQRVFDPFFTTKSPGEGTGLGLAMVHGTVAALGGAIDVRSWPGAGTIVRIDLPRSAETPASVHPDATPAPAGNEGLHVLLVDDETAVRRVAHRMLERSGFRVTDAGSGDEALARFRAGPDAFDAVLTDFNMPGMTGIELACEMQALRADTPVVLASGYVDSDALAAAERCGVRRIVHKPFSPSEIASAVSAAIHPPAKVASRP